MAAARSKVPAIGSAQWILEERHQSNDLVAQELEDFGFSVRNELEWLNEHMTDIFANNGQHNLDVFKTPGKLRGKTPRTARKKTFEVRQPLANLFAANIQQQRTSPAEKSLRDALQMNNAKFDFRIAEDAENVLPLRSPVRSPVRSPARSRIASSPVARQLFSKAQDNGQENVRDSFHTNAFDEPQARQHAASWSQMHATQDTVMSSQPDDVFSPPRTQTTQATQSFRHSLNDEDDEEEEEAQKLKRRDTGDSFVSANEAFAGKSISREDLHTRQAEDAMEVDDDDDDEEEGHSSNGTVVRHELDFADDDDDNDDMNDEMDDIAQFPEPPRVASESYSIGNDTQEALHSANWRSHAPESKMRFEASEFDFSTTPSGPPPASPDLVQRDDSIVHHDVEDEEMDAEEPSEHSSPVKPLVRKSSLTFASLPAREPLLAKKSMGNRVSRTSHVDPSRARSSHMGRFTGGKSLGGSQFMQPAEAHDEDAEADEEQRQLQEESEAAKTHTMTTTQRLHERINMMKQLNEAPKPVSQFIPSRSSQPQSFGAPSKEDTHFSQPSQPSYPILPSALEPEREEDDDDDWISPIRTIAPPPAPRPALGKAFSTDAYVSPPKPKPSPIKLIPTTNTDFSAVAESTTPAGSPAGKKYADGPLSASKAKFYSALRAAKDKMIGSSTASAQVKLDSLSSSPARPKSHAQLEDLFTSPKRTERPISLFSHMRTPSKDSIKSVKSLKPIKGMEPPSSPAKENSRRTRSSTEREKQTQSDREKEMKQKQRAEERLREMREKEQSKAAAHHQKTKKALGEMTSQSSLKSTTSTIATVKTPAASHHQTLSRPGTVRQDNAPSREDADSADEMPPPPPPKSLLPTTTTKAAKPTTIRGPKKLVKPNSNDTLPKAKAPQKIMVNLNPSRYGQAPPPAARPAPVASNKTLPSAPPAFSKSTTKSVQAPPRPASALSTKNVVPAKSAPSTMKAPAPRVARPQPQAMEKPKAQAPPARADLGAARPMSRLQTVQDANRINVPPVNPAKPAKRPFQGENEETIYRPAKRPSQQAKMNPITPAHAQFAKGKIPFAESARASQAQPSQPSAQYPSGDDIKLPEIMTDSEDEDSDNEFEQPSWVNTPNLREMLSTQQLMDPEAIFGPIAPLNMEQVFPNKERHKRFRERTSSAYWVHDQVTDEEKRKEREARERLVREGAWTYNPSPRPARPGPAH